MKYAIFSIIFVMFYMWFHLGSLFLSVSAMSIILISFPVAQFVYRGIFQITMYAQLNKVMVFVIIGIAAANIFVFCDAWRQSEHMDIMKDSQHRRMAYSFRRATKAIAVSASTTSVAFAANALSPLVPFRAFGINAAIVILVNYVLTILAMPSFQMLYESYFKDCCGCCSGRRCLRCACCPALRARCSARLAQWFPCCSCLAPKKPQGAKVDHKENES